MSASCLYLPAFPLAEWIVSNWWSLLHEPSRTEELPTIDGVTRHLLWIRRHCLRSAESGLLLPALYLFNDGRGVRAEWQADEPGKQPHMLGEFVDSGSEALDLAAVVDELSRFVSETLDRAQAASDSRVEELRAAWSAIQTSGTEESHFCIAAGRMGLNPYDPKEMTDELVTFIEQSLGNPDSPLARDLTEVAEADAVVSQWSWVRQTAEKLELGPSPKFLLPPHSAEQRASGYGYELVRWLRQQIGLAPDEPVNSVEDIIQKFANASFEIHDRNHLPGRGVRAVVGWDPKRGMALAGPTPLREDNQRFMVARAGYQAIFGCQLGVRMLTDAFTWDQQASRAFAAELLAPQAGLVERTAGWADQSKIEKIAETFRVSTILVRKQLNNAGVTLVNEAS